MDCLRMGLYYCDMQEQQKLNCGVVCHMKLFGIYTALAEQSNCPYLSH
jgi:hypothetical protein